MNRLFLVFLVFLFSRNTFAQVDDFAKVTITAIEETVTVKVNGEVVDQLQANTSISIGLSAGEKKNILLEDSKGNKYLKTITVLKTDKGRNFKINFPAKHATDAAANSAASGLSATAQPTASAHLTSHGIAKPVAVSYSTPVTSAEPVKVEKMPAPTKLLKKPVSSPKTAQSSASGPKSPIALRDLLTKVKDGKMDLLDKELANKYEEASTTLNNAREGAAATLKTDTGWLAKALQEYEQMLGGRKPSSSTLVIALNNNRDKDLPFFLTKKNIKEPVDDQPILIYALEKKLKAPVVKYIVETSGEDSDVVNDARNTFPDKIHYLLPLTKACLNGDTDVVNVLIDANAYFVPDGLSEEDEKEQAKFLWRKFDRNPAMSELIRRRVPEFYDPKSAVRDAIAAIGKNMVYVEGGSFMMGCKGDPNTCGRAWPLIETSVKSFYIAKYETTQRIWEALMEDNPASVTQCPECPVDRISWLQVDEFIQKLNSLTGKKFRLPTEKEWEYAAKGGNKSKQYKYAGSNNADSVAWHDTNCTDIQMVGKKWPNELGLYDMSGNVAEMCDSYMTETLEIYKTSDGPLTGNTKVYRGGATNNTDFACLTTSRYSAIPDRLFKRLGFRLVMEK